MRSAYGPEHVLIVGELHIYGDAVDVDYTLEHPEDCGYSAEPDSCGVWWEEQEVGLWEALLGYWSPRFNHTPQMYPTPGRHLIYAWQNVFPAGPWGSEEYDAGLALVAPV